MIEKLVATFIYPGLLFVIAYTFFLQGIARKIVAKMQNRVGPPILQPFYDIIKLLGKENIHFRHSSHKMWVLVAFVSAFSSALIIPSVIVKQNMLYGMANLVIVVYLLGLSYIALVFSGVASRSIYGEVGGMRAAIQFISYEVVFLLTTLVPALKLGSFDLLAVAVNSHRMIYDMPLFALAFILTILPQINLQPFNIPNAHQEIVVGYATEFSGPSYAMAEMTHWFKLLALISLFSTLYLGGMHSFIQFFVYSISLLIVLLIIRAAIARTRIHTVARVYLMVAFILIADLVMRNV